ncbi:hypothetical protein [Metabacillus sp. Hm71]|uniref:hypothetical protein n=1 Tax=Metabacillus sp. Hm71 TaxID=3450743 RepID=UPI003F43C827
MLSLQTLFEFGIVPSILYIGGLLYIAILILLNFYYAIFYFIKRLFNKSNTSP